MVFAWLKHWLLGRSYVLVWNWIYEDGSAYKPRIYRVITRGKHRYYKMTDGVLVALFPSRVTGINGRWCPLFENGLWRLPTREIQNIKTEQIDEANE